MGDREISRLEARIAALQTPVYTAAQLVHAVEQKYKDAVVITECKDGPTQIGNHRRLDAWVMLRSWSPITMLGFEVKVSRSDWLRDKKVIDYLPMCHYLYIVAPKGIVEHSELSDGIGLMEPIGDGSRLVIRRKAVWRDIALPGELMVYVLMCRAVITRERAVAPRSEYIMDGLRRWVEGKHERHELSYAVRSKIRQKFADQETRLGEMERRCQGLEGVKRRIIELGFNPDEETSQWRVRQHLTEITHAVDDKTIHAMAEVEQRLAALRGRLEALRGETD